MNNEVRSQISQETLESSEMCEVLLQKLYNQCISNLVEACCDAKHLDMTEDIEM
jgi:type VI protein secretion system component Hcp